MRANFKNEPMFYGAIFSESLKDDGVPRLTCLLETHKGVSDDNYIGIRDLTYSAWRNKRDINLLSFLFLIVMKIHQLILFGILKCGNI